MSQHLCHWEVGICTQLGASRDHINKTYVKPIMRLVY